VLGPALHEALIEVVTLRYALQLLMCKPGMPGVRLGHRRGGCVQRPR